MEDHMGDATLSRSGFAALIVDKIATDLETRLSQAGLKLKLAGDAEILAAWERIVLDMLNARAEEFKSDKRPSYWSEPATMGDE
jgi:hypothetical protein